MPLVNVLRDLYDLDAERAGQAADRLAYASFACLDRRYLFVETPKAACSSLKWMLAELNGAPPRPHQVEDETTRNMCIHVRRVHPVASLAELSDRDIRLLLADPEIVRFTTVRNPFSRLVSAFNDKIRNREPSYASLWPSIEAHAGSPFKASSGPTFAQFVSWLVDTQSAAECDNHWRPIATLNFHGMIGYTHVVGVENLREGLRPILSRIAPAEDPSQLLADSRVNENLPTDWRAAYDAVTAAKARDFFAEDFQRFNYDANDWQPLSARDEVYARLEEAASAAIRERNDVISDLLKEREEQRRRFHELQNATFRRRATARIGALLRAIRGGERGAPS